MSIILDALRKSEAERLRDAEAHRAGIPRTRGRSRMPWWVWAVAALLAANLALLVWLLGRAPAPADAPAATPAAVRDLERVAAAGKETVGAMAASGAPRPRPDVPPAQYPVRATPEPVPAASELATEAADAIAAESAGDGSAAAGGVAAGSTTELPAGLPALEVSLHYFDGPGGRSFITINGRTARAGTVLAEGPVVEQVTADGAILNHRGQRFLLPRN